MTTGWKFDGNPFPLIHTITLSRKTFLAQLLKCLAQLCSQKFLKGAT